MSPRVFRALPLLALGLTSAWPARAAGSGATASYDWTGRYTAEEVAGPMMFMTYTVDVFRGPQGAWRAMVALDGYMTLQRLVARGEERAGALVLHYVRALRLARGRRA